MKFLEIFPSFKLNHNSNFISLNVNTVTRVCISPFIKFFDCAVEWFDIPKQATSDSMKISNLIKSFPGEFSSTPKTELFCMLCQEEVKFNKRHCRKWPKIRKAYEASHKGMRHWPPFTFREFLSEHYSKLDLYWGKWTENLLQWKESRNLWRRGQSEQYQVLSCIHGWHSKRA